MTNSTIIEPSKRVNVKCVLPKRHSIHISTDEPRSVQISNGVMLPMPNGVIVADVPSTKNTLKTTLPTMLPTAIAVSPFFAAISEAASSGADVPALTIVSAMIESLMPIVDAMPEAPSTSQSPPATSMTSPITTSAMDFHSFLPDRSWLVSDSSSAASCFV